MGQQPKIAVAVPREDGSLLLLLFPQAAYLQNHVIVVTHMDDPYLEKVLIEELVPPEELVDAVCDMSEEACNALGHLVVKLMKREESEQVAELAQKLLESALGRREPLGW